MNWNLANMLDGFHQWTLNGYEGNVDFRYNREAQSMRLNADDKRLFFLEKKGMLQSKILLKTEYSVIVGESYFGRSRRTGLLTFDGKKYSFGFGPEGLSISDSHKENIFNFDITGSTHADLYEFAAILFASVIIMHKSIVKSRVAVGN
jgi:hypothetical protein